MSADFFRYVDSLEQGPREWIASDTYIVPLMDEGGDVRMWKAYDGVKHAPERGMCDEQFIYHCSHQQ